MKTKLWAMALIAMTGTVGLQASEEASASESKYLFSNVTGLGGGFAINYGATHDGNELWGSSGRLFAQLGDNWRLGGAVRSIMRTETEVTGQRAGGALGGVYAQYLWRLDPVLIGVGLTVGGGGFGYHMRGERDPRVTWGYFVTEPQVELGLRLFEHMSLSLIGGYAYMLNTRGGPDISNGYGGLAFTWAKF